MASNEEMADMVYIYGRADGNSREVARLYAEQFPNRVTPDPRTFVSTYRRLRETGSVSHTRLNAGRPRGHANGEDIILDHFRDFLSTSCRAVAANLQISNHMNVWRVLNDNDISGIKRSKD